MKVSVSNPKGTKMAAKKKRAPKKKANPKKRRRSPAKKKPRRRRRKKNPAMHPVVGALVGTAAGGGAGVGAIAALRYFGVGSPKSRGIGMMVAGPVLGLPVAFLSPAFGAGLGAGMVGAGGAELTTGMKPREKKAESTEGVGQAPRLAPRFGPRSAEDLAATRGARRRGGVLGTGAVVADDIAGVGAVVADNIGQPPASAKLSGYQRVTRVEGLQQGVGVVVDRNGNMYVDDGLARKMST